MKALLVSGFALGDIKVTELKKTSAKTLYNGFTSTFPPPKIEFKIDIDWNQVWIWKRIQSPSLEPRAREVVFMFINNIVARLLITMISP